MELYVGTMTGTSLDAIDCALFDCKPHKTHLIEQHSLTYPTALRGQALQLAQNQAMPISVIGELDTELGELYAQAILALLDKAKVKPERVRAIGNHGQTVWHQPQGPVRFSTQLGNPNIIAARTGIVTIADFRRMDMAYGGQGAPLAPAFHAAVFGSKSENRGILNIGGIANLSFLNKHELVLGFDSGPGNMLMDGWIQENLQEPYDENGQWASNGKVNEALLETMLFAPYFIQKPPKSTGRELFNLEWLQEKLRFTHQKISASDIQATLCELTARSICEAIRLHSPIELDAVYVCGGGVNNRYLIERIRKLNADLKISSTTELGIDPQWVECGIFAWLAQQRIHQQPIDLRKITGATQATLLGAIYSP